jgi:hypothetical protein
MSRPGLVSAALRNDLQSWSGYRYAWALPALATTSVVVSTAGSIQASLFRQALGGPEVEMSGRTLYVGADWTWFFTSTLFLVSTVLLIDQPRGWMRLTFVRGVSPRSWALARLLALCGGAVVYLGILMATLALLMLVRHHVPYVREQTLWDVGLWAVGLVSLGWTAMALTLLLRTGWAAWAVTESLLAVARFGGPASGYVPFAQWMVALHGFPGTLSVSVGIAYVVLWTGCTGCLVICGAKLRGIDAL